ncbi:hypothetical protein BIV25_31890 [Streptomyces sp. MUSC 14]|uniref:allene oxide cyclase barrel-like domain-containing protein n=1 Tax=Streptomyces sp. MUSC 14 TaxID=1354889 RepID=UPI0008F58265|nr:hypothetical protein [Streptomyces sp. MUSC 14]OIJ90612.1 hypothetical protein BIV25_31890 [Streptomyces sp. MUSC 14]
MIDSFEELTETAVHVENTIEDYDDPQVGQSGSYTHELFDKDGKKIATTTGGFRIMMRRESDDQLMAYLTNDIVLEDGSGSVRIQGWIDWGSLFSGQWVYYPGVGTGGRFLGKTGFMGWRPFAPGEGGAEVKLIMFATPM